MVQRPVLLSSDCPDVHSLSTAGCLPVRQLSVCAALYAASRCVNQTCGTKRTRTDPSPGSWPRGWWAGPPPTLENQWPKCRWSSPIHLLHKIHVRISEKKPRTLRIVVEVRWTNNHLCDPCWVQCWVLGCRWTGSATGSQCLLMSSCRRMGHWPSQSHRQTTGKLQREAEKESLCYEKCYYLFFYI